MDKTKCPVCGAEFTPYNKSHIYCSRNCGYKARYHGLSDKYRAAAFEPREFECSCCGHTVEVTDPKDKRERFCCAACERKYWRDITRHPNASNQRISNYHSAQEYFSYERRSNEAYSLA